MKHLWRNAINLGLKRELLVACEQISQIRKRILQEPYVVPDVLDRRIDFMSNPGGELSDRLEFLCLKKLLP